MTTTVTIILTGLIALVPSNSKQELIALLVDAAASDHRAKILVSPATEEGYIGTTGAFDAMLLDGAMPAAKPATGSLTFPKTFKMSWFKKGTDSYGPIFTNLLTASLPVMGQETVGVISRARIPADRVGVYKDCMINWKPIAGTAVATQPTGVMWPIQLADSLEIKVELTDPELKIGGTTYTLKPATTITISNELPPATVCARASQSILSHFEMFYELSTTRRSGSAVWSPHIDPPTADPCDCGTSLVDDDPGGSGLVRCPMAVFDPASF